MTLSEEKTRVVDAQTDSFTFLGYTFHGSWRFPSDQALRRLRAKLKPLTRRQQPRTVQALVAALNPLLRGWGHYFRHGHCQTRFARLDAWVRMRLRSFLLKRKAREVAHQRWPNRFWAGLGLLSLSAQVRSADPLRWGAPV